MGIFSFVPPLSRLRDAQMKPGSSIPLCGIQLAPGKALLLPPAADHGALCRRDSIFLPSYLRLAIYAARSAASVRDKLMSGIFGCGSSRKNASLAGSKSGFAAIVAKGGASPAVLPLPAQPATATGVQAQRDRARRCGSTPEAPACSPPRHSIQRNHAFRTAVLPSFGTSVGAGSPVVPIFPLEFLPSG